MKTLIRMLIVSALVTPALAETMDEFRADVMNRILHSCLAGDDWMRPFHSDPDRCACVAGKLAEPMTMSEAVSMSNGIMPPSFMQRERSAAYACL